MKSKITFKDIISFIVGNIRSSWYNNPYLTFLLRKHIKEQIDFRIKVMKTRCYERGSCVECGCATTELQMAKKSCDGICYPPLLNKRTWIDFISNKEVSDGKDFWILSKAKVNQYSERIIIFKNKNKVNSKIIKDGKR